MKKNNYLEKGKPLRRAGIFQILAEETWRDGEVSKSDSVRLEAFRKFLRLKNQLAMEVLDLAEEKYRAGRIGTLRDFSTRQCYARALRYAYADAPELSEKEEKYLKGLRAALGLNDADHDQVILRLRRKGWEPGSMLADRDSTVRQLDPEELARFQAREAERIPDDPDRSIVVDSDSPDESGLSSSGLAMTMDASIPSTSDLDVPPEPAASEAPQPTEAKIEVESDPTPRKKRKSAGSRDQSSGVGTSPAPSRRRRRKRQHRSLTAEILTPTGRAWATRAAVFFLSIGLAMFVLGKLTGDGGSDGGDPVADDYATLVATFGSNGVRVRSLRVRGPNAPNGPALDLGEAWDLHAGLDGFLYGTASYRIFRIDPKSGEATWIAGTGRLGEPEEGKNARECLMDPASPRVDRDGNLYFRQGSAAVYRVDRTRGDKGGKIHRVFGTREARKPWKDGDPSLEARPGAIEQLELDQAGRIYFDEYSGESNGPEILGRVEIDGKLRALFLFALTPLDHSFRRLLKSFVGTGNGFENMQAGLDGGLYFVVGEHLYAWHPGAGPSMSLLQNPPNEYVVAKDGSLVVVADDRIERWIGVDKWTSEKRNVVLVAGGNPDGVPSSRYQGAIPGPAAVYLQPRDLTLAPDGTLYLLDGASGGVGVNQPRIDIIEGIFDGKPR